MRVRGRAHISKRRSRLTLIGRDGIPARAGASFGAGPFEAGAESLEAGTASLDPHADEMSLIRAELEVLNANIAQRKEELALLPFVPGESRDGVEGTVGGFFEIENSVHVEYEVRDIVGHQMGGPGPRPRLVLVSWVGYPSSFDSWEPIDFVLPNCADIFAEYQQRRRGAGGGS